MCWSKLPVKKRKGPIQTFSDLKTALQPLYPRWLDKNKTFIPISPIFPKIVFRPETIPLYSIVLLDFQNMEILGQTTGQQVINMPALN